MNVRSMMLRTFVLVLLGFGLAGCDMLEDVFENEKEVIGVVEAIAADGSSITVDGIEYRITSQTKYDDGLDSLDDLNVGDEVEVEYEEQGGSRVALEVDLTSADTD